MHCTSRFLHYQRRSLQVLSTANQRALYSQMVGKPKVFVTRNDFPEESIKRLREKTDVQCFDGTNLTKSELIKNIQGKDGIFISLNEKIDKDVIDAADQLKVIGTHSVGVDHLDTKYLKERNIKIGYTPHVLTEAVSELGMALLLATSRRLLEANGEIHKGRWTSWSPMWMCGHGLHKSTVGIIGLGSIGTEVARKLLAFRVSEILYADPRTKPYADEVCAKHVSFEELLKRSDFIIVTCALTNETKGLFNKNVFSLMKPTSIFVNISRGGTVVQEDLEEALKNNVIGAAGLDVTTPEPLPADHTLLSLPNCVVIPHIGSATYRSRIDMANLVVDNIIAALEGSPLPQEYIVK